MQLFPTKPLHTVPQLVGGPNYETFIKFKRKQARADFHAHGPKYAQWQAANPDMRTSQSPYATELLNILIGSRTRWLIYSGDIDEVLENDERLRNYYFLLHERPPRPTTPSAMRGSNYFYILITQFVILVTYGTSKTTWD